MQYNINASENVNKMLSFASETAKKYNKGEIATEYLLYGILCIKNCFSTKILNEFGVAKQDLENILIENRVNEPDIVKNAELTPRSKQVFVMAQNLCNELKSACVKTEHILFSLLMSNNSVAVNILDKVFQVNLIELKAKVLAELKENKEEFKTEQKKELELPEELLELGYDVTKKAREGKIDAIIGRDTEINRTIEILCRKTKNNPCLVGEAGVGKSAVVEGLALRIAKDEVPDEIKNKIIFSFDISGLISGTKFRGALEQKLRNAIKCIINAGNIIVFIDEIHTLAQTSSEKGEVSPADILKPYLARGEFNTIGATTIDEYKRYLEKDKALERRFQPVTINEPSKEDTFKILLGIKESYEIYHNVSISTDALKSAIELADRYITSRNFPDKAIDLIDEASSRAKLFMEETPEIKALQNKLLELIKQKKQAVSVEDYERAIVLREQIVEIKKEIHSINSNRVKNQRIITAEDVAEIVSQWTGIPVTKLTETEAQKLINLENILHKRVIGQDEAINNVAKAVRRSRVGIKNSNRPIGSFMFLGPTGVGKTELSKAVAEALFDDEKNLIRLDMSEFMESNSVSKLIGSPPGYVGFEDGGQLTEKVRKNPYSVVLFDEIEKANSEVLNILLQVLDDGRLTDNQGRLVNFQNTIIIITSNIGAKDLKYLVESAEDDAEQNIIIHNYLTKYFRPELVNRIDNISLFENLNKQNLAKIASIMLNSLVKRLNERNISLKLTEPALGYLIHKGYNQEFGARPLRRLIEQEIEDVIAEDMLCGKLTENCNIKIDVEQNKLTFEYAKKI